MAFDGNAVGARNPLPKDLLQDSPVTTNQQRRQEGQWEWFWIDSAAASIATKDRREGAQRDGVSFLRRKKDALKKGEPWRSVAKGLVSFLWKNRLPSVRKQKWCLRATCPSTVISKNWRQTNSPCSAEQTDGKYIWSTNFGRSSCPKEQKIGSHGEKKLFDYGTLS